MDELKPGWRRARFDEMVASIGATRKTRGWNQADAGVDRYVGLEHLDSNSLKIWRWGSPADVGANSDLRIFEPGDVIFARRRIEHRKMGVPDFPGVASGHALVFRARPDVVLPEFLPYFMQSGAFMGNVDRLSVGSLSPTINWNALAEQVYALPPLTEQRRMAQRCAAEAAVLDRLTAALAAGERARDSLIVHVYSRGTITQPLVQTHAGPLPASWTLLPLEARFSVQLGKAISETARTGESPIPYLRNANVQWNRLELDDVAAMAFTDAEKAKFSLRYGDILACEARHVGKSAMWREEIPGAAYQNALHRIRAIGDDCPQYLLYCMYYLSITGKFVARTGVTTIPHLPAERLRSMPFPFPPIEEQREIANVIEEYDRSLQALAGRVATARKRTLMVLDQEMR